MQCTLEGIPVNVNLVELPITFTTMHLASQEVYDTRALQFGYHFQALASQSNSCGRWNTETTIKMLANKQTSVCQVANLGGDLSGIQEKICTDTSTIVLVQYSAFQRAVSASSLLNLYRQSFLGVKVIKPEVSSYLYMLREV